MCEAILYQYHGDTIKTYFSNRSSKLPILCRNGHNRLVSWGRRQEESGHLPLGGWARLDTINTGKWEKYFPRPVKIPILSFMERNFENQPQWFPVISGQYLQGLFARYDQEKRVYIVTITPETEGTVFQRWPRIVIDNRYHAGIAWS